MARTSGRKNTPGKSTPHYPLKKVKELLRAGQYIIRENAKESALADFDWDTDQIVEVLLALHVRHFHKKERSLKNPANMLDFYKAYGVKSENIYTHFYINAEGVLVINSFKEI